MLFINHKNGLMYEWSGECKSAASKTANGLIYLYLRR